MYWCLHGGPHVLVVPPRPRCWSRRVSAGSRGPRCPGGYEGRGGTGIVKHWQHQQTEMGTNCCLSTSAMVAGLGRGQRGLEDLWDKTCCVNDGFGWAACGWDRCHQQLSLSTKGGCRECSENDPCTEEISLQRVAPRNWCKKDCSNSHYGA